MLEQRYDESGNTIYSFSNVRKGIKTRLHEVRLLAKEEVRKARAIYQKRAHIRVSKLSPLDRKLNNLNQLKKNNFVRKLAITGALYGSFPNDVIEDATHGFVPINYEMHHIIPLSLGGSNTLRNMVLVHQESHVFLHKYLLDTVYKLLKSTEDEQKQEDKKVFVEVPVFQYVLKPQSMRGIFIDYSDYEDRCNVLLKEALTKNTCQEQLHEASQKTIAKLVKDMRERGELPPDPTKGAPTVRLVKSGKRPAIKCLGRQR